MSRTIVTGVDGSDTAAEAATRAGELAAALGARLHVVCAYAKLEVEKITAGSEEFIINTREDASGIAVRTALELGAQFPGLEVTSAAEEGKAGDTLVAAADDLGAEVIVVGNKRVQGIARVLGSVARDVATRAGCDVYVVNTHAR